LNDWKIGNFSSYGVNPPMNQRGDDGRGNIFSPDVGHSEYMFELGSADLGDDLRKLGFERIGLVEGKYRKAEVFGFRVVDVDLGPAMILATTEKGDRGTSWYVTADPLSSQPEPEWSNKGNQFSPTTCLRGYGAPEFQAWQGLSMQLMAGLGKPIDPRYWFVPEKSIIQAWWAARDRLVLENVVANQTEASEEAKPARKLRLV
jgi:hypothetical protein